MKNNNIFEEVSKLKENLTDCFQHKKQIRALENFSVAAEFKHLNYLPLIKKCIQAGFLDKEEKMFLSHLLKKYEINYLDWSHRTKWLKKEMEARSSQNTKSKPAQLYMDFFKGTENVNNEAKKAFEIYLFSESQKQQHRRVSC